MSEQQKLDNGETRDLYLRVQVSRGDGDWVWDSISSRVAINGIRVVEICEAASLWGPLYCELSEIAEEEEGDKASEADWHKDTKGPDVY